MVARPQSDVHERIRIAAASIANRAPDYFTSAQREVLARTFIPALRQARQMKSSATA